MLFFAFSVAGRLLSIQLHFVVHTRFRRKQFSVKSSGTRARLSLGKGRAARSVVYRIRETGAVSLGRISGQGKQ